MTRIQRLMMHHRLQAPEGGGDGGSTGGSGEGGSGDEGKNKPDDGGDDEGNGANEGKDDKGKSDDGGVDGKKGGMSDADAKLLKDIMAKKRENAALHEQLDEIKKRFDGIDPEEVRKILKEREDAEQRKLEEKGDWDRLKSQLVENFDKERKTLASQLEAERAEKSQLQQQIADLTVGSAFSQSKFIGEELTLTRNKARAVYGAHFEFVDGKLIGYDKPAGAKERTMLIDSAGEPLGFDEALKSIVEADPDRDEIVRSKMKSGAGSNSDKNTGKPKTPVSELTAQEKVAKGMGEFLKGLS